MGEGEFAVTCRLPQRSAAHLWVVLQAVDAALYALDGHHRALVEGFLSAQLQ